jgi:hypothetical protein
MNNRQRGTVLILVLWVLTLLTLIGGFYAVEAKTRRNLGQHIWNSLQDREISRSILLFAAHRLAPPGASSEDIEDKGLLVTDAREYKIDFGGRQVSFVLEDENGKLDLNKVSEPQIREVVRGLMGDTGLETADTIVDGILDWRDPDKLVRLNGAEDEVYQDKSPPYYPANGPFHLVEELLLVNGVGQKLFYGPITWSSQDEENRVVWKGGLQDIFTVYNSSGSVVEDYAPLPLKEILGTKLAKTSGHGVLCLRLLTGNRMYQFYWKKTGKRFKIIHWYEGVVFQDKGLS